MLSKENKKWPRPNDELIKKLWSIVERFKARWNTYFHHGCKSQVLIILATWYWQKSEQLAGLNKGTSSLILSFDRQFYWNVLDLWMKTFTEPPNMSSILPPGFKTKRILPQEWIQVQPTLIIMTMLGLFANLH